MVYEDNVSNKPYGIAIVIKKNSLIWSTKDFEKLKINRDFVTRRYNVVDNHSRDRFLEDIRRNGKEFPGSGRMIFFDISTSKTSMANWCVVFQNDCRKATDKEISDLMERPEEKDDDTLHFPSRKKLPRGFSYGDWPEEDYDFKEELRDVKRQKFESEIGLSGLIISLTRKLENYKKLLNETKDENEKVSFAKAVDILKKRIDQLQFQLSRIKATKNWYDRSNVMEQSSQEGQEPLA